MHDPKVLSVRTVMNNAIQSEREVEFSVTEAELEEVRSAIDLLEKYRKKGIEALGTGTGSDIVSVEYYANRNLGTVTMSVLEGMIG